MPVEREARIWPQRAQDRASELASVPHFGHLFFAMIASLLE